MAVGALAVGRPQTAWAATIPALLIATRKPPGAHTGYYGGALEPRGHRADVDTLVRSTRRRAPTGCFIPIPPTSRVRLRNLGCRCRRQRVTCAGVTSHWGNELTSEDIFYPGTARSSSNRTDVDLRRMKMKDERDQDDRQMHGAVRHTMRALDRRAHSSIYVAIHDARPARRI